MHSRTNGNAVPWEARPLPLSQNGLLVLHVDTVSVICNGNISDHVRHSHGYCYMKHTFHLFVYIQSKIYSKNSRCFFLFIELHSCNGISKLLSSRITEP